MTDFRDALRFGILGGTFDPPHKGHFSLAAQVASAKDLDCILFIPAARPWQKSEYSHAEDRFIMTVLGAQTDERFAVSRIELDRKGPTYTIDTLLALTELCKPAAEFYFIVGADAAANLHTWHRASDLARMTSFLVVTRPGYDAKDLEDLSARFPTDMVETSPVDVSSTQVRAAAREGRPVSDLVPEAVARYIADRGLYRRTPEDSEGPRQSGRSPQLE
jgi:nicotinate-nucleotide adenylyltransferase